MLILGIETSCDETSASIVADGTNVLANEIFSSEKLHKEFGGIVPEIASRHHVEKITFILDAVFKKTRKNYQNLDLIAVTKGPGLIGSLLVGVTSANWLAYILKKPILGINHVQAHLFSAILSSENKFDFPSLGLIISGGHTTIVYVEDYTKFKLLGTTLDDAAGEAFDKVAKLLGLGYPGGPIIENIAQKGDCKKIKFPIALKGKLDFSFSGLKTAVLYYVEEKRRSSALSDETVADICASFQYAVVKTIESKLKIALDKHKEIKSIIAGGGVIANSSLRESLLNLACEKRIKIFLPEKRLCTDNAAMIASFAYWKFNKNKKTDSYIQAVPDLHFETL